MQGFSDISFEGLGIHGRCGLMGELNGLIPRSFIPDAQPPPAYVWVFYSWLYQELDAMAEERWPILKRIKGHRRLEVIEWLNAQPDWTIGILTTKMDV